MIGLLLRFYTLCCGSKVEYIFDNCKLALGSFRTRSRLYIFCYLQSTFEYKVRDSCTYIPSTVTRCRYAPDIFPDRLSLWGRGEHGHSYHLRLPQRPHCCEIRSDRRHTVLTGTYRNYILSLPLIVESLFSLHIVHNYYRVPIHQIKLIRISFLFFDNASTLPPK